MALAILRKQHGVNDEWPGSIITAERKTYLAIGSPDVAAVYQNALPVVFLIYSGLPLA